MSDFCWATEGAGVAMQNIHTETNLHCIKLTCLYCNHTWYSHTIENCPKCKESKDVSTK